MPELVKSETEKHVAAWYIILGIAAYYYFTRKRG
jgi:hypothetical protein